MYVLCQQIYMEEKIVMEKKKSCNTSYYKKAFEAKIKKESSIELFGTGKALREFLHTEDLARACELIFKKNKNYSLINIEAAEKLVSKI